VSVENERVISGFRPTKDLTIGNYLGAVKPALDIQGDPTKDLYFFGADLHGLTDHDPREISGYREEVIHDLIALGVDPVTTSTSLYLQSDIEPQITQIANRISPYVGVSRLARTPNLKEKMQPAIRKGEASEGEDLALQANLGLLSYPVLMAADIYAQSATSVAVGEDQIPHLEIAREISQRFNDRFDRTVLVYPSILAVDSLRVLSLDGNGKMSKTNPDGAIIFTDEPELARLKIKKAVTAAAGEWSELLESHFNVALSSTTDPEKIAEIIDIRTAHLKGTMAMQAFKKVWGEVTEKLLNDFQIRKAAISELDVKNARKISISKVTVNANKVLNEMKDVMTF
jgi:tryptophanyl-tRNA synthetase